ncbi:hypothetical protein CL616_02825 [archaeon]|nr:hypothetical protein [archaeon]
MSLLSDYVKQKGALEIWNKYFVDSLEDEFRDKCLDGIDCVRLTKESFIVENKCREILSRVDNPFVIGGKFALNYLKENFGLELNGNVVCLETSGDDLRRFIDEIKNYDCIVGVGGGHVMDLLKFLGMKTGKKTLAIPTTLTTHVYASPKIHAGNAIASFGYKKTIDGSPPTVALIDKKLILPLQKKSPRLIFTGLGDISAYVTAVEDWRLAEKNGKDKVNDYVVEMTKDTIDEIMKIDINEDLDGWLERYCLIQVTLCNITDWVGSAPASGAEHLFAKSLEEINGNILHGEAVALGIIIVSHLQGKNEGLAENLVRHIGLDV